MEIYHSHGLWIDDDSMPNILILHGPAFALEA